MTASESSPSVAASSWRGYLCLLALTLVVGPAAAAPALSQHLAARAEVEKPAASASASSTKSSDSAKESDKDAKAKGSEEDEGWSQYTSVQVAGFPLYIWLLVLTCGAVRAFAGVQSWLVRGLTQLTLDLIVGAFPSSRLASSGGGERNERLSGRSRRIARRRRSRRSWTRRRGAWVVARTQRQKCARTGTA